MAIDFYYDLVIIVELMKYIVVLKSKEKH